MKFDVNLHDFELLVNYLRYCKSVKFVCLEPFEFQRNVIDEFSGRILYDEVQYKHIERNIEFDEFYQAKLLEILELGLKQIKEKK